MTPTRAARAAILLALPLAASCQTAAPAPRPSPPAAAQPAPAPRDPQSTLEPRSEPGEGQRLLARMAGEWTVTKTFHPRGGAPPAITTGECTQHMIHGARFLQSDFVFHDGGGAGGDTTGTGVIGFDPATGKFTSYWVDSRSTRISIRQSEPPFDARDDQIVLFAKALGETAGPGARRSRTVSILQDGDRRLLHRQYTDTPGEEPRLVMELDMRRR